MVSSQGHDGAHALVDRQRTAIGLGHQPTKHVFQQNGVVRRTSGAFPAWSLAISDTRRLARALIHGRSIVSCRLDQLTHFFVRNRLDVELEPLASQIWHDTGRLSPTTRSADRHNGASSRIVQAAQRLQPPADFVQAVNNDVFVLDRLGGETVRMLVQQPGHNAFVPVVERAGLVPHEEDDILAQSRRRN